MKKRIETQYAMNSTKRKELRKRFTEIETDCIMEVLKENSNKELKELAKKIKQER